MSSKTLLVFVIVFVLILTACAGGGTANTPAQEVVDDAGSDQEIIHLSINTTTTLSHAPIFFAEAEGYFADAGIEMEYVTFNRSAEAVPLIITGNLDVYAGSINAGLINTLAQESSIKVVADRGHVSAEDTCVYHGIIVRKELVDNGELNGPADLAGRNVQTGIAGVSDYLLTVYLAQAGLTMQSVNLIELPTSGYIDALQNGTVDAIITPELNVSRLINSGYAVIGAGGGEVYGTLQTSVLVFGKNLLVENREAGLRFLTAYLRGVQQYNEGKTDRNVEILAEFSGENEETIRDSCWVTINPDGWIDFEAGVDQFQQWGLEQGHIDQLITEDQFWDPSLLQEALSTLDQ